MGKIIKNKISYAGGGAEGKSAYQTWLDLGNTGTEQDFLDSLGGSASINDNDISLDSTWSSEKILIETAENYAIFEGVIGDSYYSTIIDEEDITNVPSSLYGGWILDTVTSNRDVESILSNYNNAITKRVISLSDILSVNDISDTSISLEDTTKNNGGQPYKFILVWENNSKELDGKIYTTLEELGLTAPTTVGEVFMAMPEKSMLMLNVEALVDDGANVLTVTDVPKEYGVLTIEKHIYGRFRIEYSNSLGGAVFNARKWIGALKGSDGTGLVWKEVNTGNHKYTTMAELGLDGATATVQDVMDKVTVGNSVMIRTDAFNDNNWKTQCNGIQWGYLKIEKTQNGLSNIELQEVVAPNRRYFGTQSSGKFAGWVATSNTKGLAYNSQYYKIDITKGNASWNGVVKFSFNNGTTPTEIAFTITASEVFYTVTEGVNCIKSVTYTINSTNVIIGVELNGVVYGTQLLEVNGHFCTINDLTGEQFTGNAIAKFNGYDTRTYTSLAELELTADATFQDVVDALPKGGSALLGVTEFTNYQTIFPYEEGNDQFARVYIVKGASDGSRMYARWFRKDGVKEAIAKFSINNNKFDGWTKIITAKSDPYACTSYTALTGTEDLFTLPCGHYVSANINTTYNYPITDTNTTAHIYVLGCLNDPANNKGYRIILYFDNKGRMYRINEWWGVFTDNGWKEIATKTYNSVAELNRAKGTNIELVNGEDNTKKIVDALSIGEQFVSFYHNNANQNRFGIDVSYGNLINEIRITKCLDADLTANYATVTAFMNTGVTMSRIYYKTYSTDWCVNGTITLLSQLGLTSSATVDDVHNKLAVGQRAILSVQAFDNYQTLFPYADSNDKYARLEIQKGESVAHSRIFWLRKDGSRFAIGNINSSNKLGGWFEYALKSYVDSKHKYSTGEVAIGTWIDGKTIYRKTFTKSPSSNQATGNQVTIDVATISGLTNVIDIQATAKLQNYNNTKAPIYAKIPFGEMWRSNSGVSGAYVDSVYVEGTALKIHANNCMPDDIYYVTVEYTK